MGYSLYIDDDLMRLSEEEVLREIDNLPQWRREQALQFKFDLGKRQCLLSYKLLLKALKEVYGIEEAPAFCYGEHGKPVLEAYPDIHFNISHCREAVACIVADVPVGVDVESVGRYSESVARYCMSDAEVNEIELSASPQETFTLQWTKKEAAVKCLGTGINDDMKGLLLPENIGMLQVKAQLSDDRRYAYAVAIMNKD